MFYINNNICSEKVNFIVYHSQLLFKIFKNFEQYKNLEVQFYFYVMSIDRK